MYVKQHTHQDQLKNSVQGGTSTLLLKRKTFVTSDSLKLFIQPWHQKQTESVSTELTTQLGASSDGEETSVADQHDLFGNFIDSTEVTINLLKLTPQGAFDTSVQQATDDQTFFRELSLLQEKRATRIEQMSHSFVSDQFISFEQAHGELKKQGAHRSDPGVRFS